MAMDVGLARLVGFCADIAVSVVYTAFFVAAIRTWSVRRKDADISLFIPFILGVMYMLNVAQLCLQGADIYRAFFIFPDEQGGPAAYFFAFNSRILPARDCIFWTMSMLTDVLMIWRLYVIWRKSLAVILLPCMLLLAGLATGIVMFYWTIRRMFENSMRLSSEIDKWWEVTLALTIALNVLTPSLIVGRLWFIARQVGVLGSGSFWRYRRVALVLMECGALYTMLLTGWLIIFCSGSLPALWMTACVLPTLTCIVPTCLIIAINAGVNAAPVTLFPSSRPTHVSTNGVQINVTQYRTGDADGYDFKDSGSLTHDTHWSTQRRPVSDTSTDMDIKLEPQHGGAVFFPSSVSDHSIELGSRAV